MSSTQAKEVIGKSKSKSAKQNNAAFGNKVALTDVYKTPKDYIWNDVIRHEKVMENLWKETWLSEPNFNDETVAGVENLVKGFDPFPAKENLTKKRHFDTCKSFYQAKPSLKVPKLASEVIGWRAASPANTLEYFRINYRPGKKRFVQEQYGFYRITKYYKRAADAEKSQSESSNELSSLPSKMERLSLRRIIC